MKTPSTTTFPALWDAHHAASHQASSSRSTLTPTPFMPHDALHGTPLHMATGSYGSRSMITHLLNSAERILDDSQGRVQAMFPEPAPKTGGSSTPMSRGTSDQGHGGGTSSREPMPPEPGRAGGGGSRRSRGRRATALPAKLSQLLLGTITTSQASTKQAAAISAAATRMQGPGRQQTSTVREQPGSTRVVGGQQQQTNTK